MNNWIVIVLYASIYIPVVAILNIIPFLTRRTESFGVSISEEVYGDAAVEALRKSYVKSNVVWSLVIAALFGVSFFYLNSMQIQIAMGVFICLQVVGSFANYLRHHYRMKFLKQSQKWDLTKQTRVSIDTSFRNKPLAYSNGWFVIHLGIIVVTAGLSLYYYDRIPDEFVTKYDLLGNPIRFIHKTHLSVLWPAFAQLMITLVFLLSNIMIVRSKQQINSADPESSVVRNSIFRLRWSAFSIIAGLLIVLMFLFIAWAMISPLDSKLILIGSVAVPLFIVIGSCILAVTTGQGGSRIKLPNSTNVNKRGTINVDDDRYWKFGQIYYNPQDPAYFVEKRFGIGWTVNFARPIGWVILLVIVIIVVVVKLLGK